MKQPPEFMWIRSTAADYPIIEGWTLGSGRWLGDSQISDRKEPYLHITGKHATASECEYTPAAEGPLFPEFAMTELTTEGVVDFARRYGPLGILEYIVIDERDLESVKDGCVADAVFYGGEAIGVWLFEILTACWCHQLHTAVRQEDAHYLAQAVQRVKGTASITFENPSMKIPVIDHSKHPELMGNGALSDEYIARLALIDTTSKRLQGRTDTRIFPVSGPSLPVISSAPNSLLGYLWLSFAEVLAEESPYRQCKRCGRWFEYERKSRQFCTDTCRVGWHERQRRRNRA